MRQPDMLAELATELRGMPARHRQEILKSLSPAERSRMTALLNRPSTVPAPVAQAEEESRFDGVSPWLKARLLQAQAREPEAGAEMTTATRQLLVRAAEALADGPEKSFAAAVRAPASRSLLGAIGGRLLSRRALA